MSKFCMGLEEELAAALARVRELEGQVKSYHETVLKLVEGFDKVLDHV